jgi:DNA polymerase I-like protein with 3'-5' exonuclease and polymerase domains
MRHLAGGSIRVPEDLTDLATFHEWLNRQHTVAVDTETTGLDIYAGEHRCRLLAVATPAEAWVVPVEDRRTPPYGIVKSLLEKRLIMHNASYDIQVLARHYGNEYAKQMIVKLWSCTRDTKILAHQVDPRGREEGGIGQSLDELVKHYMPEHQKLGEDLKNEYQRLRQSDAIPKSSKAADMWRLLPVDNELYNVYAGTDAILTARLFQVLQKQVDTQSQLTKDDHKVAMIATLMDAKGFLLDREYTQKLADGLYEQEQLHKDTAWGFGLENINSTDQVYHALIKRGISITETTPKGNPKVDKNLFAAHMDDPLVKAIVEGKKAGKWRKTWVEKFLHSADSSGRVHPSTNTLRARTARFSITGIPAQTLPSSDALIRSCFVSDTGEAIVGFDYKQQEPRFAGAKAPDANLIKAFRNGEDIYVMVAESAWPGHGLEYRKDGKGGFLTTLYGGGSRAMMDQWGMTEKQAIEAKAGIRKIFPGLSLMDKRLAAEAEKFGFITTWTGRKLPVDPQRLYAASNYYIQSGCRDLTAHAMIRLYDAGYVGNMRLAIHDELLFSLPNDPEMVADVVRLMSTRVGPLDIPAEAKVGSRSWGSLYE